ncbi:outer membrane usher protein [Zobellella sp. DQSA1]|uniref:outer membrane usher protein n=1 Tax=Zobellella sp. DQSA1 TaxID=3342386 RepID=UPI0035BF0F86
MAALFVTLAAGLAQAEDIQFNLDVLDVADRANIDLGQFSRKGYIMPGDYSMAVHINKQQLPEQSVSFYPPEDDPKGSELCIGPGLVGQLGLKPEVENQLSWWREGQCLNPDSLPGMSARGELGTASVYISIPQAYLEYAADNWDPPSRWDEGVAGLMLDYNLSARVQGYRQGSDRRDLSGNGVVGLNLGAWRVRADWQARVEDSSGSFASSANRLDWSRFYAYRPIPELGAKLSVGEEYLNFNIFDSFRFTGASLLSDDNMLPPNLRGYAPEVTGTARTNAKVIISQQGRVLYETQVAAGPFRIQDLSDAVRGELDVRVEEEDGSVQEFSLSTATIPYLTRPGAVRYKMALGRPSNGEHSTTGPWFGAGEFSWGVSNGWSLYGGAIAGDDYGALAQGIGRDLMRFGALSLDMTQSWARLPQEGTLSGGSYRLSYAKGFEEYDSQVTFAGYRFSERDFMSMGEYLDALAFGRRARSSKERYTITASKHFRDLGLSGYVNYNHDTYWDEPERDRYSLTLSRQFNLGRLRGLSSSLTAYRNKYDGVNDDGMYLSLSMPWGTGSVSYSGSVNQGDVSHQASYYDRLNERDSYRLSLGSNRGGTTASGYYNHRGDIAQVSASASHQEGQYSSVGMSLQGGATLTANGAAFHRAGAQGGTRVLVDTGDVPGVPVRGHGASTATNHFGKAVVTDVSSYYRSKVSIDLNAMPDNAEAIRSVTQGTLTEGAIGYRRFEVVAGEKAMVKIRLANGSAPPFGATVINGKEQDVGIVGDDGDVYLSGIRPGEEMTVRWNGEPRCALLLPEEWPEAGLSGTSLSCRPLTESVDKKVASGEEAPRAKAPGRVVLPDIGGYQRLKISMAPGGGAIGSASPAAPEHNEGEHRADAVPTRSGTESIW